MLIGSSGFGYLVSCVNFVEAGMFFFGRGRGVGRPCLEGAESDAVLNLMGDGFGRGSADGVDTLLDPDRGYGRRLTLEYWMPILRLVCTVVLEGGGFCV
jgi:hypothetical protein